MTHIILAKNFGHISSLRNYHQPRNKTSKMGVLSLPTPGKDRFIAGVSLLFMIHGKPRVSTHTKRRYVFPQGLVPTAYSKDSKGPFVTQFILWVTKRKEKKEILVPPHTQGLWSRFVFRVSFGIVGIILL